MSSIMNPSWLLGRKFPLLESHSKFINSLDKLLLSELDVCLIFLNRVQTS